MTDRSMTSLALTFASLNLDENDFSLETEEHASGMLRYLDELLASVDNSNIQFDKVILALQAMKSFKYHENGVHIEFNNSHACEIMLSGLSGE